MMTFDAAAGRPPLVLLVDPSIATRHWMWRALSRVFGVLEAGSARAARDWMACRADIDALVVENELPDERGVDLVRDLARDNHPAAWRAIVLARPSPEWSRVGQAGATLVERGDLGAVLSKLAGWFLVRDAAFAKALLREADRLSA
jgi:hypothetical protein